MAAVAMQTAGVTAATSDFEMVPRALRGALGTSGNNDEVSLDDDEEAGGNGQTVGADGQMAGTARPNRARRLQRAVRDVIREHYLCFVLVWLLLVLALAIATFVTFIEMLIVFRKHHGDPCDVPLDLFIWINIVTFIYHNTLHLCIQRWLGYDPALYNTDEPVPEAVRPFSSTYVVCFLHCISPRRRALVRLIYRSSS
jgi:hypothetical protein